MLGAPPSVLDTALAVGAEWLGAGHPILECLKLGVAIHHGALPTAFRKEVEGLLRQGALNVTVSSPTLAQGLNLSATTLLFHGLTRNGTQIDISEFRNVVGRAGRAYVDVEGLVLLPMYGNVAKQRAAWKEIVKGSKGKEMESGLLRLVLTLLQRMLRLNSIRDSGQLVAYLAGTAAWEFQRDPHEPARVSATERTAWGAHLTALDTAILSMLGETEVPDEQIEASLDEALKSSLWSRRLSRRMPGAQELLKTARASRSVHLAPNHRGPAPGLFPRRRGPWNGATPGCWRSRPEQRAGRRERRNPDGADGSCNRLDHPLRGSSFRHTAICSRSAT